MKHFKFFTLPKLFFFLIIITMTSSCDEEFNHLVLQTSELFPTTRTTDKANLLVEPGEYLRFTYTFSPKGTKGKLLNATSIEVGLNSSDVADNMSVFKSDYEHAGSQGLDGIWDTLIIQLPNTLTAANNHLIIQLRQSEIVTNRADCADEYIISIVDKIWSAPTISAVPTDATLTAAAGEEISFDITVSKNALTGEYDNFIRKIGFWSTIDGGATWVDGSVDIFNSFLTETTKTMKYTVPSTYTSGTLIDLRIRIDFVYADANGATFKEIMKAVTVE